MSTTFPRYRQGCSNACPSPHNNYSGRLMKIFGTVFPFVEPNDQDFRMGRFIANYDFLAALLTHSHFDQFHLFCMNPVHLQDTASKLSQDHSIPTGAKNKIQLFLYPSLIDKLKTVQYHVFHLGGWGYFFSGLAQLRSRFACSPFPITGVIHSLNHRDARNDVYKLLRSPIGAADAIICTSDTGRSVMQKQLQRVAALEHCEAFAGQLAVIPLGVVDSETADKQQSRQALGIGQGDIVLLYLGRLSPNTKADLYPLLLCFKQLLSENQQPLQLILAGGANPTEQALHQELINELSLQESVWLLCNFDPGLKSQLYAAADISVAPADNLQETFGISIVESMQAGLPVVASDLDGYRDLVDEGTTGFRIRTTWIDTLELTALEEIMGSDSLQTLFAQAMAVDLQQLQQRLQQLIDSESLRHQLGANGRAKVQAHYLWSRVIADYETLWEQLQQQRQALPATTTGTALFGNDYLNVFSHYPTARIHAQQRLVLTAAGRDCLSSGKTPPIYSDVAMLLDQEWLSAALQRLQDESREWRLGELLSELGDTGNRGRFSLLWASKYGLVAMPQD